MNFVLEHQTESLEHILPFTFIMISTELVIIVLSAIRYVYLVNYEAIVILINNIPCMIRDVLPY